MISITKTDTIKETKEGKIFTGELRGLSADTKPTEINGQTIGNGSCFIEMDTGKIYFFDAESETWKEF
jgi:hypothetical protein